MIQIYIDNKLVDIDNTNISLQKEFATEVENIPTEVEYSYTISLPTSLNNKEIFGFIDVFDVGSKFSRVYNAELYVDEVLILKGKFKITSIEEGTYKGNIYSPKKKTISDILGDRQLNEIKPHYKPMNGLDDFDKTNNTVCGIYGNDITSNSARTLYEWASNEHYDEIKDEHIVYPYVLYGLPMNNVENISEGVDIFTQDLAYEKHNINENNVFPAFNVLSVLKDMFATEGYNLTGNIFETTYYSYFNTLYQTFQFAYADYAKQKEVPFYCHLRGEYRNFVPTTTGSTQINKGDISRTLEIMNLTDFEQKSYVVGSDDDYENDTPSNLKYGVDNPWSCGGINNKITAIEDEKKMFTRTSDDKNAGYIMIPKSGWYKINCFGGMRYPYKGRSWWQQDDRELVGGTLDEADNTDLSEQPFEFQIKKGYPKDSPKLYSYNSLLPCVPVDFLENNYNYNFNYDCDDTYLRINDNSRQRRYGKNGKTTLINNYSNFNTTDFICGVRLGDAWFNGRNDWNQAYDGSIRRPNRFLQFGAGLTLPDPSKATTTKRFKDERSDCDGKRRDGGRYDREGTYLKISDKNNTLSYNYRTAQVLVKHDSNPQSSSFSNFEGYNELQTTGLWDTTSNYGRISYEGLEDSSASTTDKYSGSWDINTVVWLEQGDILYLEVLMPVHFKGEYEGGGTSHHSNWNSRREWVNVTNIDYDFTIGFLNSRTDWTPKAGDGVESFVSLKTKKLTNVNQFLPTTKCNDYLEKFLKTFNLQLTMVNDNTFSIDSNSNLSLSTNIIDIDKLVNIDDAEFKPLSSDSTKQLCWKNDLGETGYIHGNNSPYCSTSDPWDESGYTGNYSIVNEANTSGSVKKIESQWSYNWYKTIKFINPMYAQDKSYAEYDDETKKYYIVSPVPVIADADVFSTTSTYAASAGDTPKTNKTSRLFFVYTKEAITVPMDIYGYDRNEPNEFIEFTYNVTDQGTKKTCNLIIPYETLTTTLGVNRYEFNVLTYDKDTLPKYYRSITDKFFDENINGGYQIDVPIKLTNQQYADVKAGTMFKLNNGLYRVKSIEGHDVNKEDDATLSLLTLK